MSIVILIIGLVVGILLVLFGAQNAQPVSLHFFGWDSASVPLVLALGVAMLVGGLLTLIVSVPGRVHGWRERRALQREVETQHRAAVPPQAPPAPPSAAPEEPRASDEA